MLRPRAQLRDRGSMLRVDLAKGKRKKRNTPIPFLRQMLWDPEAEEEGEGKRQSLHNLGSPQAPRQWFLLKRGKGEEQD